MTSTTAGAGLKLNGVELVLERRRLFGPLDIAVAPGQAVTVMGPSGCGKSSLLAYICGTLEPAFRAGGHIVLDGVDIGDLPPERRQVGILFQDDLLFPHLSVAGNLAFGLPAAIRDRRARQARIEAALAEADLVGFADRDPSTLSGGQRARIALMRTLLSCPRALLLDEPFAKLDIALRARFRQFVFEHTRARGVPTLLVTHDPADASAAGGPVVEIAPLDEPDEAASRAPCADGSAVHARAQGDRAAPAIGSTATAVDRRSSRNRSGSALGQAGAAGVE